MSVAMDGGRPPLQSYNSNGSQGRPRSKSGFSIHSDNSGKTKNHLSLTETHEEKEKRKISGKANPNAAMTELQPVAAALEKPTLGSLRSLSYNDQYGNPIMEPDRSNPTRPRWERPLETIRSFDAAIDAEYRSKRVNAQQSDNQSEAGYQSRRTSSYWGGGYDSARSQRYSSYGSQYGGNRDSYAGGQQPGFRPQNRMPSDPQLNRNPYAGGPVQPHSRDTVATGSGSASGSEPWASGTDPTNSENSSIDRVPRDTGYPDYSGYGNGNTMSGANGPYRGGAPISEDGPYGYTSYQGGANNYFASQDQPPVPPKHQEPRPIISLGGAPGATPVQQPGGEISRPQLAHQDSAKRKSWLRRRLSGRG